MTGSAAGQPAGELSARLRAMFLEELEDLLGEANTYLLALERTPGDAEHLRSLFRVMHTLKGAARAAHVAEVERVCHRLEALLASARDQARALSPEEVTRLFAGVDELTEAARAMGGGRSRPAPPTAAQSDAQRAIDSPRDAGVRVGQDRIDNLFGTANSLLIVSAQIEAQPEAVENLHDAAARAAMAWQRLRRYVPLEGDASFERDLAALDDSLDLMRRQSGAMLGGALRIGRELGRLSAEIARGVRELRLRPFADAVGDLPRVARDVANATGKQVRLEISGENVQADRVVLAQIREALLHLVRNAVDHGIEAPEARRLLGKPEEGVVRIRATLVGDRIVVRVSDDGTGLDIPRLREQLVARRDVVPDDDRALARKLFIGGLTTRDAATAISGRGVGLDAVRAAAERIRGGVDVDWTAGGGTTFTIEAPLTLATMRAVLVRVGRTRIAIPAAFIDRLVRVAPDALRVVDGRLAIETNDAPAPVTSLAAILGPPLVDQAPDGAVPLVLVRVGDRRVALRADELLDEAEVVVRPIRAHGRVAVPHVSGAAMLATGTIALVLNVTAAIATALGLPADTAVFAVSRPAASPRRRVLVVDDSITTRTLEASVLEAAGYDVITAVDGADGWRLLQERGADLVVSDVEMPRMDGLQLTETIRGSSRFRELPVILVTALETPEHRARGLEIGADAYLGKSSFEQQGLLNTIRELLG